MTRRLRMSRIVELGPALLAPVLSPHDPIQPVGLPMQSPGSGGFLLGTDSIGRDILSRVLFGWRSSWFAIVAEQKRLGLDAMEYLQAGARRSTREILDAFASLAAERGLTTTGAAR